MCIKISIASLIILLLISCKINSQMTELMGKEMPSVKILLSDSITYLDTRDIPKGKPTVIFFFSPYCDHCRAQMKNILKNIETMRDIQLYAVTYPPFNDMLIFRNHFQLQKYSNVTIGMDSTLSFFQYFQLKSVPFTAIYDNSKRLVTAYSGEMSAEDIKSYVLKQ